MLRSQCPNQPLFKGFCSDWLYWSWGLKPVSRWSSFRKGERSVAPMEGVLAALRLPPDVNQHGDDEEMGFNNALLCANGDALSIRYGTQPSIPPVTPDRTNTRESFLCKMLQTPAVSETCKWQVKVPCYKLGWEIKPK